MQSDRAEIVACPSDRLGARDKGRFQARKQIRQVLAEQQEHRSYYDSITRRRGIEAQIDIRRLDPMRKADGSLETDLS